MGFAGLKSVHNTVALSANGEMAEGLTPHSITPSHPAKFVTHHTHRTALIGTDR
jgi:hypothetical protein